MSMPGFTATNSLAPTVSNYYGGPSHFIESGDMVNPEFLGFIKEAFESITHGLSDAVMTTANAIGDAISNLSKHGGPGGSPFVCGQWVTGLLSCTNGRPTYSMGEVMARCASLNPMNTLICSAATPGMYELLKQACADGGNNMPDMIGRVCKGK